MPGVPDHLDDCPCATAVCRPLEVVGLIEQDQFPRRSGQARGSAAAPGHFIDHRLCPLVAGVELYHLPSHVMSKGVSAGGLPRSRFPVQDQGFGLTGPVPGPLEYLADRRAVPYHFVKMLRPVFFRPVHIHTSALYQINYV